MPEIFIYKYFLNKEEQINHLDLSNIYQLKDRILDMSYS